MASLDESVPALQINTAVVALTIVQLAL